MTIDRKNTFKSSVFDATQIDIEHPSQKLKLNLYIYFDLTSTVTCNLMLKHFFFPQVCDSSLILPKIRSLIRIRFVSLLIKKIRNKIS